MVKLFLLITMSPGSFPGKGMSVCRNNKNRAPITILTIPRIIKNLPIYWKLSCISFNLKGTKCQKQPLKSEPRQNREVTKFVTLCLCASVPGVFPLNCICIRSTFACKYQVLLPQPMTF